MDISADLHSCGSNLPKAEGSVKAPGPTKARKKPPTE